MIADFLLVQKIRNGDNQSGNQLVEKYYSSIYQYCYLHTHNQEYAEDMVQETFERFFGALISGAEIKKTKSYLYSKACTIRYKINLSIKIFSTAHNQSPFLMIDKIIFSSATGIPANSLRYIHPPVHA